MDTISQPGVSSYTSSFQPVREKPPNQALQQGNASALQPYIPATQPGDVLMMNREEPAVHPDSAAVTQTASTTFCHYYYGQPNASDTHSTAASSGHLITQQAPLSQQVPLSQHKPLGYNPTGQPPKRGDSAPTRETSYSQICSTLPAQPLTQQQDTQAVLPKTSQAVLPQNSQAVLPQTSQAVQRSAPPESSYMQLLHDHIMRPPARSANPSPPLPSMTRVSSRSNMDPDTLLGISMREEPLSHVPPSAFAASSQIPAGESLNIEPQSNLLTVEASVLTSQLFLAVSHSPLSTLHCTLLVECLAHYPSLSTA